MIDKFLAAPLFPFPSFPQYQGPRDLEVREITKTTRKIMKNKKKKIIVLFGPAR